MDGFKMDAVEGLKEDGLRQALFSKSEEKPSGAGEPSLDPFLGCSRAIADLAVTAQRVLRADSPILILGETGAGKSALARWLHRNGARASEPFVELNCAGLTRDFLETELFGHERGAFTGAIASKQGLLEIAEGGTVFLDEIGDMELEIQPKLLKVLEERRYRRLGDVRDRRADVRLIAATHQDLGAQMEQRGFRSDLYFRISTIQLHIPALRERREDIPMLIDVILRELCCKTDRRTAKIAAGAMHALKMHSWPGNLRELRNVLERALLFTDSDLLCLQDLRFDQAMAAPAAPDNFHIDTDLSLEELERRYIERVLREEGGHVAQTATRLRIPRSTLYQKLKTYRISVSEIQKNV